MYSVTDLESYLSELDLFGEEGEALARRLRELSRNVEMDEILAILNRMRT